MNPLLRGELAGPEARKRWNSPYFSISAVFVVLLTLFQATTLVLIIREYASHEGGRSFFSFFTRSFVHYGVYHLIFIVLILVRESNTTRLIQVNVFLALAVSSTLLVTPREIGGDLAYLLGGVLAYKYGYMEHRPGLKITALIVVTVAVRTAVVLLGYVEPWRAINQAAIIVAALPILYWIFEADLIRARKEQEKLEERFETQAPFAEFGHYVGGIVHDFKNDLSVFGSFGRIVRDADCALPEEVLEAHDRALAQMQSRINAVMFVTQPRSLDERSTVRLREAIDSVLYAVRSDERLRKGITADASGVSEYLTLTTQPLPLITILENALRNSLESIHRERGDDPDAPPGQLIVIATEANNSVEVIIRDSGTGFQVECPGNILDCLEPGFSTKSGTGGFGLTSIRASAARLGASVDIRNVQPHGSETTITIPVSSEAVA